MARIHAVIVALFITAGASPVLGAASTACWCPTEDGNSFTSLTRRHSRWACDYKLGYLKSANKADTEVYRRRSADRTCNSEEISQYRVWLCVRMGCTYRYSKAIEEPNKDLNKIVPIGGRRTPSGLRK